jgi:hypothetical protein
MESTSVDLVSWIEIVSRAWRRCGADKHDRLAAFLAKDLGIDVGIAEGLVAGVNELVMWAREPFEDESNAVETEKAAMDVARRAVLPMLQAKWQAQLSRLDARDAGKTACPNCGKPAPSQGQRGRRWLSLAGLVNLVRRYDYCALCKHGHAPAQNKLGLPESAFTPRVEEVATLMATTVPHGMAVSLVEKLLGVEMSVKAIEEMTERRAQALAAKLHDAAAQCTPFDATGLPVAEQVRPVDAISKTPTVAYLEMDGVVPMTREELSAKELSAADRRRQKRAKEEGARGGRGRRYRLVGREVKNAVLYEAEHCAREGSERGCITDKSYVSHLGDWLTFAGLLWVALLRKRFDRAGLLVVLSDGADWIRSVCNWLPVPTLLILDLFHVKHRIWEVANELYGERTPRAARWAETQCDRVESGKAREVIEGLRFLGQHNKKPSEKVTELAEYLTNNLDRMDYPAYKARGLRVGSGAVESANYHVTGARLKLQGMRWSEAGAREMAYLRADLFNGNWERTTQALMAS